MFKSMKILAVAGVLFAGLAMGASESLAGGCHSGGYGGYGSYYGSSCHRPSYNHCYKPSYCAPRVQTVVVEKPVIVERPIIHPVSAPIAQPQIDPNALLLQIQQLQQQLLLQQQLQGLAPQNPGFGVPNTGFPAVR